MQVQGRQAGSLGDRGEGIRCIADCLGYRLPRWWLAGAHQRIHVHTVPPKEDFRFTPMKACRVAAGASRQQTSGKHWKHGEEVYQQQLFELATRLLDPNGTRASWAKTELCDVSVEKVRGHERRSLHLEVSAAKAYVAGEHALRYIFCDTHPGESVCV